LIPTNTTKGDAAKWPTLTGDVCAERIRNARKWRALRAQSMRAYLARLSALKTGVSLGVDEHPLELGETDDAL
jgi:hypothetical protein